MQEFLSVSTSTFLWLLIFCFLAIITVILLSKVKLIMTIASFAYPNARFNAMGNSYVNLNNLEQLSAQGTIHSAAEHVANRYYPLKNLERIDDIEQKIIGTEINFFKDVYETVPDDIKPVAKCFLIKWESRHLKNLLAEKIFEAQSQFIDEAGIPEVELNKEILDKIKNAPTLNEVLTILGNSRYYSKLKEALKRNPVDFIEIERILDNFYIYELNELKSKMNRAVSKPTEDFINLTNDITNLKVLLRAKFMGFNEVRTKSLLQPPGRQLSDWKLSELAGTRNVPELVQLLEGTSYHMILEKKIKIYKKTKDIQLMELVLDRYYLDEIVALSMESTLTVGPAIRFLISKEYETRNLITVLRGLQNKLPSENVLALTVYEKTTT